MIVIPPKKIKSHHDTIMYLSDPDKFKTFYLDLREYLKSTQHQCIKERYEDDPRMCIHNGYHEWPESVPFRRFNHFCYQRGLDWKGARDILEIMLHASFYCECRMLKDFSDEDVEAILSGRRK